MDFTKDKRSKWKALHIYEGIRCAKMLMKHPEGPAISGCNADGIALQFHADRETGKVVVKEMKDKNFYPIGDGDKLTETILFQLGGESGMERIRMERLFELWGGKENYERLFGLGYTNSSSDSDGHVCAECGAKLIQAKLRCRGCTNNDPQFGR